KNKISIPIEMSLVIAVAGLIPVIVLPLDVNGEFFTEVQFFVSIGVVVAYSTSLPPCSFWLRISTKWRKAILALSFIIMCDVFYSTAHPYMRTMIDVNFDFRKKMLKDISDINIRLEITKYLREGRFSAVDSISSVYGRPVQEALNKNSAYHFLKKLRKLNALPIAEKKQSLMYLNYKQMPIALEAHCFDLVFFAPSLSGIAQLHGMYVKDECNFKGWGFDHYQPKTKEESLKNYSDSELCEETLKRGFSKLFVYRQDHNDFEIVNCSQSTIHRP
ncbi:MAG: hypothetical protein ACKO96_00290, partial [Flammeovirgaceae bacterium]